VVAPETAEGGGEVDVVHKISFNLIVNHNVHLH